MKNYGSWIIILLLSVPLLCTAQDNPQSWQDTWHELYGADEPDEDAWQQSFDLLEQLAADPLDLNQATPQQLEQLPFLSDVQVMDIMAYRDRYGPLRSLGELRMVRSLNYVQLQLLPFFVCIAGPPAPSAAPLPPFSTSTRHEAEASVRLPFYRTKGDINGYLGPRLRHELRYRLNYANRVKFMLMGSQDAGEPFFAAGNRWGYDTYTYYVQLTRMGMAENAVAGKFRLSVGKGLVMGNSFMPGKLAALQSMGRTASTLRPHTSRSQTDYLQGVAATLRLSRHVSLTPYASWRPLDATLAADSSATTLITSGYHRTPAEMQKKHNTHATDAGLLLQLRHAPFQVALFAAYTHLDRQLQPNTSALYRRYYAAGRDFLNYSLSYAYAHHRFSFSGETAADRHAHIATTNALSLKVSDQWSVLLQQRFYSYRYQSLHAHSLSEGGRVQNESALLVGTVVTPLPRWHIEAYADYAYFPWARYQVSQSSSAADAVLSSTLQHRRLSLSARYRCHRHQLDNDIHTGLNTQTDHRARLSATYSPTPAWSLKTQADLTKTTDRGLMLSHTASCQPGSMLFNLTAAWFHTDSYQSRIYLYERPLPHQFSLASYYGHGIHFSLLARVTLGRWQCHARLGLTHYFDRQTTGTALQQVDHPTLSHLDLQLRYRWF